MSPQAGASSRATLAVSASVPNMSNATSTMNSLTGAEAAAAAWLIITASALQP